MDTRLNETKKTPTARAKRPPRGTTLQAADFEKLLSDFSAALVRVSVAEIDNEIERWLEQIVLAMNVDRCTVVQVDPADGGIYNTHQWGATRSVDTQPGPERKGDRVSLAPSAGFSQANRS